jgi:hypothetical protein
VELAGIYRELREHGSAALEQMLPLLQDQDASVRGWAAAHALQFAPQQATAVLEELAAGVHRIRHLKRSRKACIISFMQRSINGRAASMQEIWVGALQEH